MNRYDKQTNRIAKGLLVVAAVLFALLIVVFLQSVALVHGYRASDWYVSFVKVVSILYV